MSIRLYKPNTPGRRLASVLDTSDLTDKPRERRLAVTLTPKSGRNNQGKITVRHRGGRSKRFYRLVDFKQDRLDTPAKVVALEYDPNRSGRLALLEWPDGERRYILAPLGLAVGASVISSNGKSDISTGNRLPLEHIPTGLMLHNIELKPGEGGQIVRSAGVGATLMVVEGRFAQLKMPSGEIRLVPKAARASIGQLGNIDHINVRLGKAGRKRWQGIRPTVRGKAMNPVDHPHGGGEGVQPIGLKHPKTPWGKPALGVKTRRPKSSNRLIVRWRKAQ